MTRTITAPEAPLTDRQREVVALIAAGCSNDEVGQSLGISTRTAKAHSDVLRVKLGVARRRRTPMSPASSGSAPDGAADGRRPRPAYAGRGRSSAPRPME
jgi:DNA-binding CsgD family transcriptional regulator